MRFDYEINITGKWASTHLLDKLDDADKFMCVILLEQAMHFCLNNQHLLTDEKFREFQGIIFPIVRRLFSKKITFLSPETLYEEYQLNYEEIHNFGENIISYNRIDIDCEMTRYFIELIEKKYGKEITN